MCLLLESIRVENRQMALADKHSSRMNHSRRELFGAAGRWDVRDIVAIPSELTDAVYKCRILYDTAVQSVELIPYTPRSIRSLRLVEATPELDYSHKYADRTGLDRLYAQRGECDDILIVRDGLIADTSYSNIALYDGGRWYTPLRPLLRGVRITSLLEQGAIHEADIRTEDLRHFQKAVLLNAMLRLEDAVEVDVREIVL